MIEERFLDSVVRRRLEVSAGEGWALWARLGGLCSGLLPGLLNPIK